jgi:hypothetical protein
MGKIIGFLLLALLAYVIITQPQFAADATRSAVGSAQAGADSVVTFVSEMGGPTSPATPAAQQLPSGSTQDCAGRADGVNGVNGRVFTCPAAVPVQPPPVMVNPDGSVG